MAREAGRSSGEEESACSEPCGRSRSFLLLPEHQPSLSQSMFTSPFIRIKFYRSSRHHLPHRHPQVLCPTSFPFSSLMRPLPPGPAP